MRPLPPHRRPILRGRYRRTGDHYYATATRVPSAADGRRPQPEYPPQPPEWGREDEHLHATWIHIPPPGE